jgi:hypothetical protein
MRLSYSSSEMRCVGGNSSRSEAISAMLWDLCDGGWWGWVTMGLRAEVECGAPR